MNSHSPDQPGSFHLANVGTPVVSKSGRQESSSAEASSALASRVRPAPDQAARPTGSNSPHESAANLRRNLLDHLGRPRLVGGGRFRPDVGSSVPRLRRQPIRLRQSPRDRRLDPVGAVVGADRRAFWRMDAAVDDFPNVGLPGLRPAFGRPLSDQRAASRRVLGAVVLGFAADDRPASGAGHRPEVGRGTSERREGRAGGPERNNTPASGARSGTSERREGRASGPERNDTPASGARSGTSERREGRAAGPSNDRPASGARSGTSERRAGRAAGPAQQHFGPVPGWRRFSPFIPCTSNRWPGWPSVATC